MRYQLSVTLLFISVIATNEALRILVCFPMTSPSHSILGHGVVNRLLEAGHEVVHITAFPRAKEKAVPKLTEINVSSIGDDFKNDVNANEAFKIKNIIGQGDFGDSFIFSFFTYTLHKKFLEEPQVVKLFSDPKEKFDAVVLEWFFSELNGGVPSLFQAPGIWLCSTEAHWQALRIIDEIPNPAYTVDIFATSRPPLSFFERAHSLWKVVKKYVILNTIVAPIEAWTYYNIYPELAAKRGVTMPSYTEAIYNASLMFVNAHPSIGGAIKLPQNAINIAGYHINDEIKPLPKDLQKLMDEAKHGVVYFSMGSNFKSDGMSNEMQQGLLKMFSKFKETVIWKFESDNMKNIPLNVHLIKWTPQPSILNHTNLKLFITHGGLLSTTEAIHYGVPLVGLPVMADQHINMISVQKKGFGIKVKLSEDMFEELETAVRKLLSDPAYRKRAKEISSMYHNRPMKPGAELAYWVDYVVKTSGAPHLRSPAVNVPLYQKLFIDVLGVLILVLYVIMKITKMIWNKWSKKSGKKKEKKN